MRIFLLTALLLSAPGSTASAAELEVVKDSDETANDAPLTFEFQRAGSGRYAGWQVWGKVHNDSGTDYENVQVILTAYDAKGRFLGRGRCPVYPSTVGDGQVGYLDQCGIEIGNREPAKLTWKVVIESF